MNLLRALGFGKARANPPPTAYQRLPLINSFVEVALGGSRHRDSVSINEIGAKCLVTRRLDAAAPGVTADFVYTNDIGKFRFATVCSKVDLAGTYFDMPAEIKTIESFADRRRAERVPWIVPVQWRYAPDGEGYGPFLDASMMDLSRGGASLVVGRELKVGSRVEVRFVLKSKSEPFVELCQVVRAAKIETSDKNAAGIQFMEIDRQNEQILAGFVTERQALRRSRGVI
jgi:hypothetical protein